MTGLPALEGSLVSLFQFAANRISDSDEQLIEMQTPIDLIELQSWKRRTARIIRYMSGIVLCLNEVETPRNGYSAICPYCRSESVRRWGTGTRNVFDTKPINAVILRYYCIDCNRTFRYYPNGMDRSQLSQRIRRLAALLWLMDISTRDVEEIFEGLGVSINRMTVWREGQKLLDELTHRRLLNPESNYKICRSTSTNGCNGHGFSFSICLDSSTIAMLGTIQKSELHEIEIWLKRVLAQQEIEILNLNEINFSTAERMYVPL